MCGGKEYPISGVTNYGQVLRKGAEKLGLNCALVTILILTQSNSMQ